MRSRSDRGPHRAPSPGQAPGFTLLELLIVLSILALLLTLAPRVTAGLPGYRLRTGASQLAETFRALRDEAIRSGQAITVSIDAARRRYRVGNQDWHDFSSSVDRIEVTGVGPLPLGAATPFVFFPDGSAEGGTITFWHQSLSARITLDWLTGRIRNG